jgi:hypothetical protein
MDQGDRMFTNRNTGEWLRLCADLEHEAAPPFQATLPGIEHISQEFQRQVQELGLGPLEPEHDVGEDDKREFEHVDRRSPEDRYADDVCMPRKGCAL